MKRANKNERKEKKPSVEKEGEHTGVESAAGNPQGVITRGKPYRSKLQEHWPAIRALRARRKTWQEIAEELEREHGCRTQRQSVMEFYRRKIKGRVPLGFEPEPESTRPARPTPAVAPVVQWDTEVAAGFFDPPSAEPVKPVKRPYNLGF